MKYRGHDFYLFIFTITFKKIFRVGHGWAIEKKNEHEELDILSKPNDS